MPPVRLVIEGDPSTGSIGMQGPLDDARLMYWLLGEGWRLADARLDERDRKRREGPDILLPGPSFRLLDNGAKG